MKITDFFDCGDTDIELNAVSVFDLQQNYDDGLLSKEEYVELLEDIQNTIEIQNRTAEIELKANFLKAVSLISKAL